MAGVGMHGRDLHGRRVCIVGACIVGGVRGTHAPSPHQILRDTVNERALRILLECILVFISS